MAESAAARQVCVLLREGLVLTDDRGRLPSYDAEEDWDDLHRRAQACGDEKAVLVAPQLRVRADPTVMLSVFGSRSGATVEGIWTGLAEVAEDDDAVLAALLEVAAVVAGHAEAPARRPRWFSASWYDEVEAWVDEQLAALGRSRTGPSEPTKVWSMSAVLRVPCNPSPVWFKAACRHFHAEPALTRLVAAMVPAHAPTVIATDDERGWILTEDMAGADEDAVPEGIGPAAARIAATLQLRSLDHLAEIDAAGVPVRDLTETRRRFDEILAGGVELDQLTPDELLAARGMRDDVRALLEELDALGIPNALTHGDLHPGNVAPDGDSLLIYDWSDASLSHPFLDLVLLGSRLPDEEREATREAYAAVWHTAYPALDTARALELAVHANTIFQMVTYEQIYVAQEDASYWEMRGVVSRMLRNLPQRFPSRS
jgi:aminoglycoside phosphotransferase (APT) family kinase protein